MRRLLAALAVKFTPGTPYSPEVGARLTQAGDLWAALTAPAPRLAIPLPTLPAVKAVNAATAMQKKMAVDPIAQDISSRIMTAHAALM